MLSLHAVVDSAVCWQSCFPCVYIWVLWRLWLTWSASPATITTLCRYAAEPGLELPWGMPDLRKRCWHWIGLRTSSHRHVLEVNSPLTSRGRALHPISMLGSLLQWRLLVCMLKSVGLMTSSIGSWKDRKFHESRCCCLNNKVILLLAFIHYLPHSPRRLLHQAATQQYLAFAGSDVSDRS